MANIFVTRKIPGAAFAKLGEAGHTVDISEKNGGLTKEELIVALKAKPYDAVLSLLTDKIDAEVMDAAPSVKIYANYATGYDNIDVKAAIARGVTVTNAPALSTPMSVAEHTIALLMTIAKRIEEADDFTRAGKYVGWDPTIFLGVSLSGKTLGIIGAGRIGSMLARYVQGFRMKVLYHDIARNDNFEQETGATYCATIEELLPQADFVSLHVPLLPSTRHLINAPRLALMKSSAILLNTSRGPVVDEAALVDALKRKVIRSAGLDVFENEPALTPGLTDIQDLVLTPHIASADEQVREEMTALAVGNILDFLAGKKPANAVEA